jgi:hypothetical protein
MIDRDKWRKREAAENPQSGTAGARLANWAKVKKAVA